MTSTEVNQHTAAAEMREIYQLTVEVVVDLSEDQLRWREKPTAPSIRFHLFHIARWADLLQAWISGVSEEIWDTEQIAVHWGLDPETLGYGQSGAMIDDDFAMNLPLPNKDVLLEYTNRVLEAAIDALATIDTERLQQTRALPSGREITVEEGIIAQLAHTSRHLGMIECLRGIQGLRGTATV